MKPTEKAFARVAAFALLFVASAAYADISGRVVGIIDGDTLDVLVNQRPVRVRLAQIDAPEKRQAFGTRARQALSSLTFRHDVTVIEGGPDRYGRTIGTVYVGALNVNNELVRQGMAWAYRRYVTDPAVIQIEAEARSAKRGLWADPSPVPPWDFRHNWPAHPGNAGAGLSCCASSRPQAAVSTHSGINPFRCAVPALGD